MVLAGIQLIGALLETAFDIIALPFRFIWENCKVIITAVWDAIETTVSTVIDVVCNTIYFSAQAAS